MSEQAGSLLSSGLSPIQPGRWVWADPALMKGEEKGGKDGRWDAAPWIGLSSPAGLGTLYLHSWPLVGPVCIWLATVN